MRHFHQILFIVALLALSWFGMMAFHELSHVIGALTTGGVVERVVLHPLTISRTDVSPNPYPLIVVWLGPIFGCLLPAVCTWFIPKRLSVVRNVGLFFTGFCLLANGAYIAVGSFGQVADCGVMLQQGSPLWTLLLFGLLTIPLGLYVWHRMGSVKTFLADPSLVEPAVAYVLLTILAVAVCLGLASSAN